MKKLFIAAVFASLSFTSLAQSWTLDKAHAKLAFTITHLGISEVDGTFKGFDAKLTASKPDFSDAQFELTAPIKGIDTNMDMRNEHFQGENWFNAAKYADLSFKSTGLKPNGANKFKLSGDLTMKGVTKPVVLDLTLIGTTTGRDGKKIAGFKASGVINRAQFGVGGAGNTPVTEEVELRASGEFKSVN